jgi:hypothetical protein
MNKRAIRYGMMAGALLCSLAFLMLVSVPAQEDGKAPIVPDPRYEANPEKKPTPRAADGHVDFTGFWIDYYTDPVGDTVVYSNLDNSKLYNDYDDTPRYGTHYEQDVSGEGFPIPYKPQYLDKIKATAKTTVDTLNPDDPYLQCKPLGITRLNRGGHHNGFQMVQNPTAIGIMYEEAPGPIYRVVYMDGRRHPRDLDTSYEGHSIGHWDKDTLVVDVTGLNDETLLDEVVREGPTKGMLLPHSDQEHVIEHWSRKGDVLTYSAVVEDPVMFTRPWEVTPRTIRLSPSSDYMQPEGCVPNQGNLINRYKQNPEQYEKYKDK